VLPVFGDSSKRCIKVHFIGISININIAVNVDTIAFLDLRLFQKVPSVAFGG